MGLPPLSREQQNVINYLNRSKENIFVTGKAGTGKTNVLLWYQTLTNKKIKVAAPTGMAAVNAAGSTIHNLLGLRIATPADAYPDYKAISAARKLLDGIDAIVIDEVSMVSSSLMDAIDRRLRMIRTTSEPFGGLQIIMFGDLYQLPPVVPKEDKEYYDREGYRSEWFFDADVWQEVGAPKTFDLQEIHRQNDPEFKEILNGVRDGSLSVAGLEQINHLRKRKIGDPAKTIMLGSRKKLVADYNATQMRRLRTQEHVYQAKVNAGFGIQEPADRKLVLKVGMPVLMLNNDREERWVNGSQGVVTACTPDDVYVEIEGAQHAVGFNTWVKAGYPPEDYKIAPKFHQLPLRPAWAMTIHKSQGQSMSAVQVDLTGGAFAAGQTYVALSRATSPAGLYLRTPIYRSDIRVDPNVTRFFETI